MSATTKEREQFIAYLARELPEENTETLTTQARYLLRNAASLQRLAEAQCNGDWPYDNGERKTKQCAECEMGCSPSALINGRCPDCRITERVRDYIARELPTFTPEFGGDPRGAVLILKVPSGRSNDWGHRGIVVPS